MFQRLGWKVYLWPLQQQHASHTSTNGFLRSFRVKVYFIFFSFNIFIHLVNNFNLFPFKFILNAPGELAIPKKSSKSLVDQRVL